MNLSCGAPDRSIRSAPSQGLSLANLAYLATEMCGKPAPYGYPNSGLRSDGNRDPALTVSRMEVRHG